MSENYEKMTVLELRKVAKDMGVKLGAGISKQGIIEKLTEASAAGESVSSQAPAAADTPAAIHPVRSASIITDDEGEDDDVPVLTPNMAVPRPMMRPAPASIVPESGVSSSLGAISSKAPAFTMEGSRAWHNPRSYQPQTPAYQPRPQSWNTRPAPGASGDPRGYSGVPRQRMDPRMQGRAPAYPNRFGPDMGGMESGVDYRASGVYNSGVPQDYQPREYAPRGNYMPRNEYAQPRDVMNSGVPVSYNPPVSAPYYHKELGVTNPAVPEMLATGECGDGQGVLEVHPDGYGFLRTDHFRPGKNDVYVANAQIRRFNLRSGDYVAGKTRPQREGDRYSALLYITEINGKAPEESPVRPNFEDFTAIFPKRRITLSQKNNDPMLQLVDLMAPIGFGQRALITVGPKTGKALMMKKLAAAIRENYAKAHLMVLLVDETPEAVTEIREEIKGEVIDSTFDEPAENHAKVCELALERAQRLVEMKKDVIILTDNLTRMARAYNAIAPQNARSLEGGLAAGAMNKPKKFFGAARNTREGGTLTIIGFALSDTGSQLDDAILNELQGTANMELHLDRQAGEKRLAPMVKISSMRTRHDELMLTPEEKEAAAALHALAAADEKAALEKALALLNQKADQGAEA